MNKKLISEIAFLIKDSQNLTVLPEPYIYAKISPPIEKDSLSDIKLIMSVDF